MRPIAILKTGDTLPGIGEVRGDFDDWISPGLGVSPDEVLVIEAHRGDALPNEDEIAGVVVTGSPAMVTHREPWSEGAGVWLAELARADRPILGICYGHQLLADALGGEVGSNPLGREIGTVEIEFSDHRGDPLLSTLPARVDVHTTHVESVLSLPRGATLLARSEGDPHHAYRIGERVWGVQFHPEFDADIMRRYIAARAELIESEGLDAGAIADAVRETPMSASLIGRFAALVRDWESA